MRSTAGTEPDDDDGLFEGFALVRPYVVSLTDPPPAQSVIPSSAEPITEPIPVQTAAPQTVADAAPIRQPHQLSRQIHGVFVFVAVMVLVGAGIGVYASLKPHNTALPLPPATAPSALLPATASTASEPTAEPSAAQTSTHAAGTPTAHVTAVPTTAVPSSGATSAVAALAPPSKPKPTTAPGTNLAARRPVVDSGHNEIYVASNAVDGNPNTYWESTNNAFPQSITVDLGASVGIGRIVVALPRLPSWVFRTQTILVSGSLDGASFTTIAGAAGYAFNPLAGNTATISLRATQARYVRLTFTANTAWPAGQASEIEIFAP